MKTLAPIQPLVLRPTPYEDEGFTSFLRRSLAENVIPSIRPILKQIGALSAQKFYTLGARKEMIRNFSRLLGLTPEAIVDLMRRNYPTRGHNKRRVSPKSLQAAPYDPAVWSVLPIPYCPYSLEMLIEKCPACGKNLHWRSTLPIVLCQICSEDLRKHPSAELPVEDHQLAIATANLLSLDADKRDSAVKLFPSALQTFGASELFEVGLQLGRIISPGFSRGNLVRDWSLELEAGRRSTGKLPDFLAGFRILMSWPGEFEHLLEEVNERRTVSDYCTMMANLRAYASTDHSLSMRLRQLILSQMPVLSDKLRRPTEEYTNDCRFEREYDAFRQARGLLTHREAAGHLGIKMQTLADVKALGHLPECVAGIRGTLFSKDDLDALCTQMSDRVSLSQSKRSFGISSLATEQLLAARVLTGLDNTILGLMAEGPFVRKSELNRFLGGIYECAGRAQPTSGLITLGEAMGSIGERDKPWLTFFEQALAGSIAIYPPIEPRVALESFRVRQIDLPKIQSMIFSFDQFPEFKRSCVLSGPEWAEYLNIGKPAKEMLVAEGLLPINTSNLRYLCPLDAVNSFAADNISIWEIRAVLQSFSAPLPLFRQLLDQWGFLATHGIWFWSRQEIEESQLSLSARIRNVLSNSKGLAAA